jgi:prepilin-type N-terminal cleavage/methylation domain-containing protein
MRKAFTLAEVLITLTIIGVVAALTMPGLIAGYQKKVLETQFKKAYSMLSQAILQTNQELGVDSTSAYTTYHGKENGDYKDAGEFHEAFFKQLRTTGTANYTNGYMAYNKSRPFQDKMTISCYDPNTVLPDGSSVCEYINASKIFIGVDLNGPKKGPNAVGHDIFYFLVRDNVMYGYAPTEMSTTHPDEPGYSGAKCSKNDSSTYNGLACSYYAIQNICPDDESKTYWECLP